MESHSCSSPGSGKHEKEQSVIVEECDTSSAEETLQSMLEIMESIALEHSRVIGLLADFRSKISSSPGSASSVRAEWSYPYVQRCGGPDFCRLSRQEQRVLELIGAGMPNRLIAREMALSEQTIKNYLSSVFRKLGVRSRTEAVVYALGRRSQG